jgi:hypothetical protein
MKVNGIEITDEQIGAMVDAMSSKFRASDIATAAERAGVVDQEVAMRAADRFIQQQKKKGWITLIGTGPYWTNQ